MNLFSNAFRGSKPNSGYLSLKNILSCAPGQSVLGAINRYKDYLTTQCGATDTLVSALTMSSDLIGEQVIHQNIVTYHGNISDFSLVPDAIASDLITGLEEACHNGSNVDEEGGISFTDSSGCLYNVIDVREYEYSDQYYDILFAVNDDSPKLADSILISKDGKIYLNNFIRSANFKEAEYSPREKEEDDLFLIQDILSMLGWDGVEDDILSNCKQLNNYDYDSNEIMDQINYYLSNHAEIHTDSNTITGKLSDIWDFYAEQHGSWTNGRGRTSLLWNSVKDLIESSTLNTFLAKACDAVLAGFNSATAVGAIITEAMQSKYKSIRAFGSGVYSAYHRGGVYGVACYVVSFIKDITSVEEDDGLMKFTDNSRLTPQIYIAGIVSTIVTVITTLISLIISIFSKIAGAIIAVIGTLVSMISKAIQYDYSSTNAALNTSDNVLTPTAPYGIIQSTYTISAVENDDLISLFNQGVTTVYAEIPGSILFIGPGAYDDTGSITKIRCEIHPLIVDPGDAFDDTVALIYSDHGWVSARGVYPQLFLQLIYDPQHSYAKTIADSYASSVYNTVMSNEDNDVLSNAWDAKAREYILKNLFITGVFLFFTGSTGVMNDVNQFNFSHDGDDYWLEHTEECGFWAGFQAYAAVGAINWDIGDQNNWILYLRADQEDPFSWKQISDYVISPLTTLPYGNLLTLINLGYYYDDFTSLPSNAEHAIYTPEYDKASFWANVVGSAIITAAVAVTTAIVAFKVRKAIFKQRALNQAKVAQAYDNYVDDPTDENYTIYHNSVLKNNLYANLIGGSKYDYVSYWNGDTSNGQPAGSTNGTIVNYLSNYGLLGNDSDPEYATNISTASELSTLNAQDLNTIIRLIAGPYTPLNR